MNSASVGLLSFLVQLFALGLFSCGFFEFRASSQGNGSREKCAPVKETAQFDRLVFVLIDALRSDFVYGQDSGFAFINKMLNTEPEHALGFIARARPPTVTMPRLKALTAGSPPIFLDLILNFDETAIVSASEGAQDRCGASGFTQDTWIRGLKEAGKKIVFYGDDTWVRLFPGCFDELHGVSSFFVQDYTNVDNQVTERAVPRLDDSDWDALILHYLGIDHIGHIDGAYSKLMGPKQREMDQMVELIYEKMAAKDASEGRSTLVVVLGDHGMADNGNHGGSSDPEVNTAAVVFSPSKAFRPLPGRQTVNQVDFVPTIAGLFGLHVPESSTGVVIESMIPNETSREQRNRIMQSNVCQLEVHLSKPPSNVCDVATEKCSIELRRRLDGLASEVAESTGEYKLHFMLGAILLTAVCIAFSVYRVASFERSAVVEVAFVLAYVIMQSSSSFIEEEHEFWYFVLASLIVVRYVFMEPFSWAPFKMLLLARIPRYWNSVGYQRAQELDARAWLPPGTLPTVLIFAAALGFCLHRYPASSFPKALYLAGCALILAFKTLALEKAHKVHLARACYASVLLLLCSHVATRQHIRGVRWILALLFLFLLKIHNALIIAVLALLGDAFSRSPLTGSFLEEAIVLSFVHYSYFALGPSNLLVSLDFSNAYIGLTQFNMALVSAITFLMTWSGPSMAALLFVERPTRETRCLVSDLSLWRSFVALGLLINLTIQRNHLFIWTVFAPRLLFEFGWAIFYAVLLVCMNLGLFRTMKRREKALNICMVSDFFYPNMGGVENHLFCLSQCLLERGHKVVIVTHAYEDRSGVRWLSRGLKVYYLPVLVMYNQCTLPSMCGSLLYFRDVFIREQIDVVHGHQAFSSLAHEAILHAAAMGIVSIFTDHSLFGFSDTSSILTNKLLMGTLANVQAAICVSHTSKENTVLRASIVPERVYVIPNAVVPEQFQPDPDYVPDHSRLTIVVASRLVYRKGIDLLVAVIPKLCQEHPGLRFVIAGDGPKRVDLEQMREKHFLMDRVELVGAVASHQVRDILVRGDIFLNTSLTEAFCMAIVEAASCGLLVVSTRVGGIPEVLPADMIILARPEEEHLHDALEEAIAKIKGGSVDTSRFHERVGQMYSWHSVAERTEAVYYAARNSGFKSFVERLERMYAAGAVYGKVLCILAALELLILRLLDWLRPPASIPPAPIFSRQKYSKLVEAQSPTLFQY